MVMELKVAPVRSFTAVRWLVRPSKTRSSRVAADPLGATPPTQLDPVLHLLPGPAPLQMNVAGASRVSSCSRLSRRGLRSYVLPRGRTNNFNQRAQVKNAMAGPFRGVPTKRSQIYLKTDFLTCTAC